MKHLLTVIISLLAVACGSEPKRPIHSERFAINQRVQQLREWAPIFEEAPTRRLPDGRPGDNGDMVLFNGLLCSVDVKEACEYVKASQFIKEGHPHTGRFFRSPQARKQYEASNVEPNNAFSRDMMLGVLLYLAHTKDVKTLQSFGSFLQRSKGQLCFKADDNRCDSGPNMRYLLLRVSQRLKQPLTLSGIAVVNAEIYLSSLLASARFGELGFPQHLIAVQVYLLEELSLSKTFTVDQVRQTLHSRNPKNAFFSWLARDYQVAISQFFRYAPSQVIEPGKQRQWSFERADAEEAHLASFAWDFIFLGKLMSKEM